MTPSQTRLVGGIGHPFAAEIAVEGECNIGDEPGAGVDAVGDVPDGHFVGRDLRPDVVPHFSARHRRAAADAVDAVGQADGQHRHGESLLVVGDIFAAQGEEPSSSSLSDGMIARKYLSIISGENVSMPAGTGVWVVKTLVAITCWRASSKVRWFVSSIMRMRSRARKARGLRSCGRRWAGCSAPRGADAADAQDDFLLDAHFGSAAVELGGDFAIGGGVFLEIGVEQIERNAADVGAPDFAEDGVVAA